jgi:hypothetical protein
MGRGHEIDVMAPAALQFEHYPCQAVLIHLAAHSFMTDLVVLTETALEVAVGKKDSSRTAGSAQRRLLTEVGAEVGDFQMSAGAAKSALPFEAVRPAPAGTKLTGRKYLPGLRSPCREFPGKEKAPIWSVRFHYRGASA